MRESRSAASCARTGLLREKESCSCSSSLADRHPRTRFSRSLSCADRARRFPKGWAWILESGSRKRAPGPDKRRRCDPIALRRSKRRKPGALAVREIDPRHPANQPAGANSRVTPVLALSHSRTTARVGRTCSPNRQESMKSCAWKVF